MGIDDTNSLADSPDETIDITRADPTLDAHATTVGNLPPVSLGTTEVNPAASVAPRDAASETVALSRSGPVHDPFATTVGNATRITLRNTEVDNASSPIVRPAQEADRSDRYRIDGEIARGGMGAVLKGRDPELGRDVAIKVLLTNHGDNAEMVHRFFEEAQIGGQLQHPGIVPIYELGTLADRRPFFSMKLVQGRTLADLLKARADPADDLPRFLSIFAAIAQTMAYAHTRGVIHRDLKPANVMVGSFGEVQVMDWGLAKVLGQDGGGEGMRADDLIATARSDANTELSRAGSVMGTPSYMAPEQARGETGRMDERADVFALGSILCEILSGAPAFTGKRAMEIVGKAAKGEIGDAWSRLESCGCEAELIALAKDCLAVERDDRPRDAHVVANRITGYLSGVQERVQEAERDRAVAVAKAIEERRRRKVQLALAASLTALLLATVAGTAATISVQLSANAKLKKANIALDEQRTRAEQRETQAIDAVNKFRDAVANNGVLKNNPSLESLRKTLLKEPLAFFKALRDRLQADQDTRPESLAHLAQASYDLGKLTEQIGDKQNALIAYRESSAILQKLADANPSKTEFQRSLAKSYNNIGGILGDTGKADEALKALDSALAIRRKLADANPTVADLQLDAATTQHNIIILKRKKMKPAEALKASTALLAILQKLADAHPANAEIQDAFANGYLGVAVDLRFSGKPAESLEAYKSALAILRKQADAHPTDTDRQWHLAIAQHDIGHALRDVRKPDEAMKAYELALAISQRVADANPTSTNYQEDLARTQTDIGIQHAGGGRPAEALKAFETALRIRQKLADDNPKVIGFQSSLAGSHDNLGIMLRETGQTAEALKAGESALSIRRKLVRDDPESFHFMSDLGANLNNLAQIDLVANRFEEAHVRVREAIEWQRKALASNPANPQFRRFLSNHLSVLIEAARGLNRNEEVAEAERELAKLQGPGRGDGGNR